AERNIFVGSILVRPAGFVQSVARLSLEEKRYRFAGILWFTPAGPYEANVALTIAIADWAMASVSVVAREAAIAEAVLGTEIGLGGIRICARGVWDGTGFREFRLRFEVPFGPSPPHMQEARAGRSERREPDEPSWCKYTLQGGDGRGVGHCWKPGKEP
ncbi:MAG: hypothetical protein ACPLRM_06875, partial [Anaerolineae bacterium]